MPSVNVTPIDPLALRHFSPAPVSASVCPLRFTVWPVQICSLPPEFTSNEELARSLMVPMITPLADDHHV